MIGSINRYIKSLVRKKLNIKDTPILEDIEGVSIITSTNRPKFLENILANFIRQDYETKELILIINNNSIDITFWKNKLSKYKNIRIYKLDEKISLGRCLNYGIEKSSYPYLAKFDDDDYYGSKYLSDSLLNFNKVDADIVGKHTIFVYFMEEKILAIKDKGCEDKYVYFLNGATLVFKKKVFEKVQFRNVSVNEDVLFCRDAISHGFKVYSGNKYHFTYLRYAKSHSHTWKVENQNIMNLFCSDFQRVNKYKEIVDISKEEVEI